MIHFFITLLYYYSPPPPNVPFLPKCKILFFEKFADHTVEEYWTPTSVANYTGAWQIEETKLPQTLPHENALVSKSRNSYSAISTKFKNPISILNDTFILQYEMRPQLAFTCSGAYIKLFSGKNFEPNDLSNETQYTIMFGPDRCSQSKKIHFIFNYFHPKRHIFQQKAMKQNRRTSFDLPIDIYNHLYTLIIRPNNTFSVLVDNVEVKNGSLFFDFEPPLLEPREIDDINDKKPDDWVDVPYVVDTSVKKPEDWDDRETIPDPEKLQPPEGWLSNEEEMIHSDPNDKNSPLKLNPKCLSVGCGQYKPPQIPNPNFKGKWKPKLKANPAYKGEWKPRKIKNPYYFIDMHPHNFPAFTGIGFEIWHVNREISFQNILIANDEDAIIKWNNENFLPRKKWQLESYQSEDEIRDIDANEKNPKGISENFGLIANSFNKLYRNYKTQVLTLLFAFIAIILVTYVIFVFCCKRKSKLKNKSD